MKIPVWKTRRKWRKRITRGKFWVNEEKHLDLAMPMAPGYWLWPNGSYLVDAPDETDNRPHICQQLRGLWSTPSLLVQPFLAASTRLPYHVSPKSSPKAWLVFRFWSYRSWAMTSWFRSSFSFMLFTGR